MTLKLRVRPDAPAGSYSIGPLAGDFAPGVERSLDELLVSKKFNDPESVDLGLEPLSETRARDLVASSNGLLELVEPAGRRRAAAPEQTPEPAADDQAAG